MVRMHHRLDGHESEQVRGVGDGQGSLACYSPWVDKELDKTERLNKTKKGKLSGHRYFFQSVLFTTATLVHSRV